MSPLQGKKVLVLDDEEIIREITGEFLGAIGCEVGFAEEGESAVRLYKEALDNGAPFDLFVTDLTIPGGMGGIEALAEIKKLDPGVKAIVSSGDPTDPVMIDCKDHGFAGAIAKPYVLGDLKELVCGLLEG
jgi:CheY-like chemotaxis protein